jgi:hypothetical protein
MEKKRFLLIFSVCSFIPDEINSSERYWLDPFMLMSMGIG